MSLLFYSRARFTTQLMPLLLASPDPAHIISVFGPGRDASFFPEDISLRDPQKYGFMSSGSHAAYMKTFYWEYLAAKYPGKLAFCHYFPGLVIDDRTLDPSFPWWFKLIWKYGRTLFGLFPSTLSGEESGVRTLFNASERFPARSEEGKPSAASASAIGIAESSDGVLGGGAYRVNWNNEQIAIGKQYTQMRADDWAKKLVDHTHKAWADIESTGQFLE
jgi:hypothetical protein